jgi:hypothetical protein
MASVGAAASTLSNSVRKSGRERLGSGSMS